MYGIIHVCLRELILSKFGEKQLSKIMLESGLDEQTDFLTFKIYSDDLTLRFVQASTSVLDVPTEALLDLFGEYFLEFAMDRGYGDMLRGLGSSFQVFVANIDYLHWYLMSTAYPGITSPAFTCHEEKGEIILWYYSYRSGYHHVAIGLLRAIARELFQLVASFEVLDLKADDMSPSSTINCVCFKVHLTPLNGPSILPCKSNASSRASSCIELVTTETLADNILVSSKSFRIIMPYHIIFDSSLSILQLGSSLRRWCPGAEIPGAKMESLFTLQWPNVSLTYKNVTRFDQLIFQLALNNTEGLVLKGEIIPLENGVAMIFLGVPFVRNLAEMQKLNLRLSDLPKHDSARELILLQNQRSTELDLMQKLEEMTVALKSTAKDLEAEKSRTENLLHSLLPAEVASKLKQGEKVQQSFAECTVLFSDIVCFTVMASKCSPLQVIDLLNALYSGFDSLTEENGVYKVETIGDAYMVVGGVPLATPKHAERVAHQALGMLRHSRTIQRPDNNSTLQIRVGMHSGPVVAGCVGLKMPRYCLFGDTVNTASRMESHGVPCAIHISDATHRALDGKGFRLVLRGNMTVKGKGEMSTYFLIPPGEEPPVEAQKKVNSRLCQLL